VSLNLIQCDCPLLRFVSYRNSVAISVAGVKLTLHISRK
jgi:hypothetical protein